MPNAKLVAMAAGGLVVVGGVVALAVLLSDSSSSSSSSSGGDPDHPTSAATACQVCPTDATIRYTGRMQFEDDGAGAVWGWPGTSAAVAVRNASSISAVLANYKSGARFLVEVDSVAIGDPFRRSGWRR